MRIVIAGDVYAHDKVFSIKEKKEINAEFPNVSTEIYLEHDGIFFPHYQWTDLTNSILGMWIYALIKNKDFHNTNFELYFMDGPYRLDVYKGASMELTINCINSRNVDVTDLIIKCSYMDFMLALYDAFKSFNYILYCNEMHKGRFEPIYRQSLISINEIKEVLASLKTYGKHA